MKSVVELSEANFESFVALFDLYRQFYLQKSDLEGARKFLRARFEASESKVFLSTMNEEFAGFVQLYPLFTSVGMKRIWILNDLYVETKHRSCGLATLLIDQAAQLGRATGAKSILLETSKRNTKAFSLYNRLGFKEEVGSRFMTKNL